MRGILGRGACVLGPLLIAVAIALRAGGVEARSSFDSPYGYERTWNAALRLVRVDNGWKVTEKDGVNGYLLFEYRSPENTRTSPGSLELVRGSGRDDSVSVLVQLPQMPRYHEQVLLDALAAKMRREYGDPPKHRLPDEPRDVRDAGAD